jgi:hypothetical protein
MIRTVNGKLPVLSVALQAYFRNVLRVQLDDPPERDPEAIDINLDFTAALRRYYSMAVAVTSQPSEDRAVLGRRYITRFDRDSGVTIGVDQTVLDRLNQDSIAELPTALENASRVQLDPAGGATVYPDGLLVSLDSRWSEHNMRKEPEERGGG